MSLFKSVGEDDCISGESTYNQRFYLKGEICVHMNMIAFFLIIYPGRWWIRNQSTKKKVTLLLWLFSYMSFIFLIKNLFYKHEGMRCLGALISFALSHETVMLQEYVHLNSYPIERKANALMMLSGMWHKTIMCISHMERRMYVGIVWRYCHGGFRSKLTVNLFNKNRS